jgi:uncharacterized membrane protein YccC
VRQRAEHRGAHLTLDLLLRPIATLDAARLEEALRVARPALLFGLRLWASVCLALYVAFWLELDNAFWAGTSAAIVCQPQLGASLRKGWYRMIGTVIGAVVIVVLTACFPQDRTLFLVVLALWGAACAFVATLLRNFASYAAALAGYTAAIIAGDQLGATGGLNGQAFMLAVARVSEICIGIVSAGVVLAGTDLGGAPRRLATLFASVSAGIMANFSDTLAKAGSEIPDRQPQRREYLRQVVSLDPVIDQTLGESSQIRYHSPVLQRAVDGLFTAVASWRAVAIHLARLSYDQARAAAAAVLQRFPPMLLSPPERPDQTRWTADPVNLCRICEASARELIAMRADTPSMRLLADETAEVLAGMSDALDALALLMADRTRPSARGRGTNRLRIPDLLPAVINAGRAFLTIGAVALFWIVTAWPSGTGAITFASIAVILFAPRSDQAYGMVVEFTVGTLLAAVFAAIVGFALLPGLHRQTFAVFAIAIGLYLVPAGALAAQPWRMAMFTAMCINFVPILGPANPMNYDTAAFYNQASAIVAGISVGALSFRVLPPLSPSFRTRRLLGLTLRDLRRLAMGRTPDDWEGHIRGRLTAMPEEASPLQRAQLLTALSMGREIIRVRPIAHGLSLGAELESALAAVAQGESALATARFNSLDEALAARSRAEPASQTILRARGRILVLSEMLTQHAAYFDAGARA